MKTFAVIIGGSPSFNVEAEKFSQVNDFVTFYKANEVVGLFRFSSGDCVVEQSSFKTR